jgi:hypothetical protein
VESQADSYDPHARSETDSGQRSENRAEGDFQNKSSTASHDRKENVQEAHDRKHRRIKCSVAIVADRVGEEPDNHRRQSADYQSNH